MIEKRPTLIKIKLSNLINNLNIIRKIIGNNKTIITVIKANAYGHGSIEVAKTLYKQDIKYFAVASACEAKKLFNIGLNCKILSLGKIYREDLELCQTHNYEITVSSLNDLKNLEHVNFPLKIHLKIDTGMGRCGIWEHELFQALQLINQNKHINLHGLLTHFPAADEDYDFTLYQINQFKKIKKILKEKGFSKTLLHCANSDAIINFHESLFDIVRPGIIIYGSYWNIQKKLELGFKPVMEFLSKVVEIKTFNRGDTIGYGRTYRVSKKSQKCALIPVGYADGFSRYFSNNGKVLINNQLCEIVGRISMDWLLVNIDNKEIAIGDKVILFGDDEFKIDIDKIAKSINTISYEILCNVGKTFRNEVVYEE
jgi:alanine racemase